MKLIEKAWEIPELQFGNHKITFKDRQFLEQMEQRFEIKNKQGGDANFVEKIGQDRQTSRTTELWQCRGYLLWKNNWKNHRNYLCRWRLNFKNTKTRVS